VPRECLAKLLGPEKEFVAVIAIHGLSGLSGWVG
jgi:hypothetical protein